MPATSNEARTEHAFTRLTKRHHLALKDAAAAYGVSVAELLRLLVGVFLESRYECLDHDLVDVELVEARLRESRLAAARRG